MSREVIKTEQRNGYEVRHERLSGPDYGVPEDEGVLMVSAYTPDGAYIGNVEDAEYLVDRRGITPELRTGNGNVCSVGFCEREQKWYGWSHRAMVGFGIGDKSFVDFDFSDSDGPVAVQASVITTLDEARQSAANFAEAVS